MRTNLHVQRRPAAARKPLVLPRDARRLRRLRRHGLLTRCGYLLSLTFN